MIGREIKDKEQLRIEIKKFMKEHGLAEEEYEENLAGSSIQKVQYFYV
jgi:hypothetical protein